MILAKHERPEDKAVIALLGQDTYDRMRAVVVGLQANPKSKALLAQFTQLVTSLPTEKRAAVRAAVMTAMAAR